MLHPQLQIKVVVHNLSLLWLWWCIFFFCNCWLSWSMKESLIWKEILVSQSYIGLAILESFNAPICPTPFCPLQPSSSVQWSRSFRWQSCLFLWSPKFFGIFVTSLSSVRFKTDKEKCFISEREPLTQRCCQPVFLVPLSRHNTLKGFVKDGLVLVPTPNAPQT
jgi:hypothetical protein